MEAEFSLPVGRRHFLGALGFGAATALLPASLLARESKYPLVKNFVDGFVSRGQLPGVLVSIGQGLAAPEIISAGTIAFASRTAVNKDTLWRIYSMTKPITGIATMMLIDQGKLTLDTPLAEILPKFTHMTVQLKPDGPLDARPAKTAITVRHLLTHTSGLGYSIMQRGPLREAYIRAGLVPGHLTRLPNPFERNYPKAPNLAVFSDRLAALPLVYEPGTKFSYSVSMDVLGRVIEVVSGLPFDHFLKERIFDPLGMSSTGFHVSPKDIPRFTTNYGIANGFPLPIDPGTNSVFARDPGLYAGGAGLVSSAHDYDRFLAMLLGEGQLGRQRILSAKAARIAMSNLLPSGADIRGSWIEGYGFGAGGRVSLPGSKEGEGLFGWNGAAGTVGWVDRKRGMRVTGMVQQMPLDAFPFQSRLPDIILQQFSKFKP